MFQELIFIYMCMFYSLHFFLLEAKKEEEEERARREKEEEEERLVPVAVSTDSGLDSPALTTTTPNTNASINEEVIHMPL